MPEIKSPLRYPGGKTQLAGYIKFLLDINDAHTTYIEPFAGGFGVGIELLEDNYVNRVVINDLDPSIYSIWYYIVNEPNIFIKKIVNTPVTIDEWFRQSKIRNENKDNARSLENAFSSFFLNRTNVSGIIGGGPIGGKKQDGKYKLDCRFNKKKLIQKIITISSLKERIELFNLDANKFIVNRIKDYSCLNTFIFFDPPYFEQGKNLYLSFVNKNEHAKLAENIKNLKDYKWITTYDKKKEILKLYDSYVKSYIYKLNYSANKKRKAEEFLFASNRTKVKSYGKFDLIKIN